MKWMAIAVLIWLASPTSPPPTIQVAVENEALCKEVVKAQGEGGKSPAEWALLAVGLVATIVVTILITRKARSTLQTLDQTGT